MFTLNGSTETFEVCSMAHNGMEYVSPKGSAIVHMQDFKVLSEGAQDFMPAMNLQPFSYDLQYQTRD